MFIKMLFFVKTGLLWYGQAFEDVISSIMYVWPRFPLSLFLNFIVGLFIVGCGT